MAQGLHTAEMDSNGGDTASSFEVDASVENTQQNLVRNLAITDVNQSVEITISDGQSQVQPEHAEKQPEEEGHSFAANPAETNTVTSSTNSGTTETSPSKPEDSTEVKVSDDKGTSNASVDLRDTNKGSTSSNTSSYPKLEGTSAETVSETTGCIHLSEKINIENSADTKPVDHNAPKPGVQVKTWWTRSAAAPTATAAGPTAQATKQAEPAKTEEGAKTAAGAWQWWNKGAVGGQAPSTDATKKGVQEGRLSASTSRNHLPEHEASSHHSTEESSDAGMLREELRKAEEKNAMVVKRLEESLKEFHDSTLQRVVQDILTGFSQINETVPKPSADSFELRRELDAARHTLTQKTKDLDASRIETSQLRQLLDALKTDLNAKYDEIEGFKKASKTIETENKELKNNLSEKVAESEALSKSLKCAEEEKKEMDKRFDEKSGS
ncbi:hypothetical protein BC829DRAFT_217043 [Chytridium lagenaria]|nr:hypothetical protein BC829DRAFT_217043 [Chytridium lagenaria]